MVDANFNNQHMQHFALPGAPQEPELVGSGVATEARVLELEAQIEKQRRQQAELIARIAEQEQQTLETQRAQLRMMDNGVEPGLAYNAHVVKESFRQHRAHNDSARRVRSREASVESRNSRGRGARRTSASRETSAERSDAQQNTVASIRSRTSDAASDDIEAPPPPTGPGVPKEGQGGKGKKMSAAEEELQMTEEALAPEKLVSLSQMGPLQIAIRVTAAVFVCAVLSYALWEISRRL